jgi:hypothetical protein
MQRKNDIFNKKRRLINVTEGLELGVEWTSGSILLFTKANVRELTRLKAVVLE